MNQQRPTKLLGTLPQSNHSMSFVDARLCHQFLPTDKSNGLMYSNFTMEKEARFGTAHPEDLHREVLMFYRNRDKRVSRVRNLGTRITNPLRFVTTEPVFPPPISYQIVQNQGNPHKFDWNLNCSNKLQGATRIIMQGPLGNHEARPMNRRFAEQDGFSLVELLVVVILTLLIAAWAIPSSLTSIRMAHLRGVANDYAGLLEQARILAIRNNQFYSTYILAPAGSAPVGYVYVDLPQGTPPAKNSGASVQTGDPVITIAADVVQQPVGSAPNTANLQSQLYPSTTVVPPIDASVTAPTFGPRGLPCTLITLSGSSICDNSGGPTAYWTFLQNTKTSAWQAVTITPAGRIKKWYYNGSTWSKL